MRRALTWLTIPIALALAVEASSETDVGVGDETSGPSGAENEAEASDAIDARAWAPPTPIGVRYGEPLEDRRLRIAYSFERTKKQGLRVGRHGRSPSDVLPPNSFNPYDRTPRALDVTVHEFQLAYAPHPRVTLVVDVPFVETELETLHDTGLRTKDHTDGVGDIAFAMVLPFIRKEHERSHIHVGFDAPTGAIRRGGDETRLPFDSQTGNGTFDLEWGWTYRGAASRFSWGGQAWGHHPIGRNDLHYREGSRFEASIWGGVRVLKGLSGSLRVAWQKQNNIRQHRSPSDPIVDPSDNSKARGGTRLAAIPGISIEIPQLGNQRLSLEFDVPFYQDLDGPQLEKDWSVTTGWEWSF